MVKVPPVIGMPFRFGKDKMTLLRLGTPGETCSPSERKNANFLAKVWKVHMGREMATYREWGICLGLGQVLPEGYQVKVFEHVLLRWGDFMQMVWIEMEAAKANLGSDVFAPEAMVDPLLETARILRTAGKEPSFRRYHYPVLGLVRLLPHIAIDLYEMDKAVVIRTPATCW